MFGMRKQPAIRTLVGEGTVIEDEIRFTDGLRIDGRAMGNVIALGDEPNLLVIGEKASIAGRVKAGHVIINGEVRGPLESSELLELQPKARIEGNVLYTRLDAHFSDRGRLFQADRGRRFSAIVDAQGMRASEVCNVSQSSTISLKRDVDGPLSIRP